MELLKSLSIKNKFHYHKDRTQKVETIKLTMSEEVRTFVLQTFTNGTFFRSGCQIFLISLTRRRFMWSTSVLWTSHSECKKATSSLLCVSICPIFLFCQQFWSSFTLLLNVFFIHIWDKRKEPSALNVFHPQPLSWTLSNVTWEF